MKCLYFILCLFLFASTAFAEERSFFSRKVKELVEQLPPSCLQQKDSIFVCKELSTYKPLILCSKCGLITHVGFSMFSGDTKALLGQPVCNFLERFILELFLQKNNERASRKLKEFDAIILVNEKPVTRPYDAVSNFLHVLQNPSEFSLQMSNNRYIVSWQYGTHRFNLTFPSTRELIFGTDKKESDEQLNVFLKDRISVILSLPEPINKDILTRVPGTSIFKRSGNAFLNDKMRSDTYYSSQNDRFVPLYSKQYAIETLKNLLLGAIQDTISNLCITHRMYGNYTPCFSIRLVDFLAHFQDEFTRYCAVDATNPKELKGTLILRNEKYNYINMLTVKAPVVDLFTPLSTFNAEFYSNLPQQYIKNLFQ